MRTRQTTLLVTGAALVVAGLASAYLFQFKHFYELLVSGLFLIMLPLTRTLLPADLYPKLYGQFVFAGLVADLLLGVTITRLWSYNYTSYWEYLPLYLIVYPVAGLVMLQMYLSFTRHTLPAASTRLPHWLGRSVYPQLRLVSLTVCLGLAAAVYLAAAGQRHGFLLALFLALSLWAMFENAYEAHRLGGNNLLDVLALRPATCLSGLLIVTYVNALLHELPNVAAQQWTYANWPFMQLDLLGVPLAVFLAWPVLALYPVGMYYLLMARRKVSG